MKYLLHVFANLFARLRTSGIDEQYLAHAVDAHDLQARLLASSDSAPDVRACPAPTRRAPPSTNYIGRNR